MIRIHPIQSNVVFQNFCHQSSNPATIIRNEFRRLALDGGGALRSVWRPRAIPVEENDLTDNPIFCYFSTLTPFQNATYPLICFAAGFGSG